MASLSVSIGDYVQSGLPGLAVGEAAVFILSLAAKRLIAPMLNHDDDRWHNAVFSPRLYENVVVLAALSYCTVLVVKNPRHDESGPISAVFVFAMLSAFWHFFLRNKQFGYSYGFEPIKSSFRNWKVALLHTIITFVACTACSAVIGYDLVQFG